MSVIRKKELPRCLRSGLGFLRNPYTLEGYFFKRGTGGFREREKTIFRWGGEGGLFKSLGGNI